MRWREKIVDIGSVKVGVKTTIVFKAIEIPEIKSLQSSCGCSTPHYDKSKKELIVIYTPKDIPVHLKSVGHYATGKSITVTYMSGSSDVLNFKAKIYK